MCGIAGFIDHKIQKEDQQPLLNRMLTSIAHRGPDARGMYFKNEVALGHNRLSIIDLSEQGNQPMHYGKYSIVYNGEIYNYLEIRKELEGDGFIFTTNSDTEVILASYLKFGEKCVHRFVGMWAFVVLDNENNNLFCSRDRFGIKPFFYIYNNGRFYFGSEYKALKLSPIFESEINLNQVYLGLQLGWNSYNDESYFKSIKSLPAASNLYFLKGKIEIQKYWEVNLDNSSEISFDDAKDKFSVLFQDSIHLHLRSDVEVGGCLSGGLDSSAIASVIGKNYSNVNFKTFNIYYEGESAVDERPWVDKVLNKYSSLEPHYFTPTDKDITDSFDDALYFADVPLAGSSPISQYFVMKLAKQNGIKVLLDGQGSDECLGGYMHSFYRLIGGLIGKGNFFEAFSQLNKHSITQGFSSVKKMDLFLKSALTNFNSEQSLYELEYLKYLPFLPNDKSINFKVGDSDGSRLSLFLKDLMSTTLLPTLLQFEDRNSMAFSIESRVPFLDHRLVEFAFSLPDSYKINDGITKRILREGLSDFLPVEIANRKDKKGFVTPGEVKWLRGPLSFLLDQNFGRMDFLDVKRLNNLVDDFKKGNNKNANLIWRAAVLAYWLEKQ